MNDTVMKLFVGAILGGIVTLALNIVRIVSTSITDSQKPRIDLLRSALEGFNEATYVFGLIGREHGFVMAGRALNLPEYGKDEFRKYSDLLDEGMRHLSNSIGHTLAISHDGIAHSLRAFQDMIFENMKLIRKGDCADSHARYICKFSGDLRAKRDEILRQFEIHLRDEARLSTAFRRYFRG